MKLRKIKNNLLSPKLIDVLGPSTYGLYLYSFLRNIPSIIKSRDLRPLDKVMGSRVSKFNYKNSIFEFDCKYSDENLVDGSYAFGIARELYIRDCYFKWQPAFVYENAEIVVDLGANRGGFSALMTTQAKYILSVECDSQCKKIIERNFEVNNFKNYSINIAMIGESTRNKSTNITFYSIDELFESNNIDHVDFMKMDIEGSEFSLFSSTSWLENVNAISLEIHNEYGSQSDILQSFKKHNFKYITADENLKRTNESQLASFVYAWKTI